MILMVIDLNSNIYITLKWFENYTTKSILFNDSDDVGDDGVDVLVDNVG